MQNKGLVKALLVVITIICAIQYMYIFPTSRVEAKAEQFAQEIASKVPADRQYNVEKQERIRYLDSISSEEIFSIPMLKSYTYDELKRQQLGLGLDLKGGQSAVLQVDLEEMLRSLANDTKDPSFDTAIKSANGALANSQSDYITLFGDAFRKQDTDKKLARYFYNSLSEDITLQSTDGEVLTVLRQKGDETVNLTFNLLQQRIDRLGVAQPNVSLDAARDLILVELPGVDNPERGRNMLQSSARLEFWDVYRVSDAGVIQAFLDADARLKSEAGIDDAQPGMIYDTTYVAEIDSTGNFTGDSTMQVTQRGADLFANQGPLLSRLTLNATGSGGGLAYSIGTMGVAKKNQLDYISNLLNKPEIASLFPNDSKFMWSRDPIRDYETGEVTRDYELYLIKKRPGTEKAPLEGDHITDAGSSPDPTTGEIKVNLAMDVQGSKVWADMTTKAANDNNRQIAIALDDEVISAPRVNGAITGGRTEISGNFTVDEANDLASMLEIGKLPARVKIIQEANVGPSLGKENIQKSIVSLIGGLLVVLAFMIFYYGGGGVVSIITLLVNIFFIFGGLSSFGTVLTLPGIAGIILTIGMAVDANVIIYERIKEELRSGKALVTAVSDGFKNSYSAILDANVTTILVAMILAYFGLGPIKGFAVVLIIGVVCSLLTAVLLGRLILDWWTVSKGKSISFWTPPTKNMFANLNIDWLGKRKMAYMFSGFLILAGLISMFTRGFDLGVDFKGGYSYNIEFAQGQDVSPEAIRTALADVFGSAPVVKAVDVQNTYNVVTDYLIADTEEDAPDRVMSALYEGVKGMAGNVTLDEFKSPDAQNVTHVISSSKVGPTIADDIKKSSFYAGFFALLAIFLYLFVRFNKWQFSLGAVAALFHDSLIVLGLFSLLHGVVPIALEIDQAFIAAILTVIGYSINDTVIVFDRIREFLGIHTNKPTDEVINAAINSTFSRTVITSLTTLFVVLILLIFGGGSIKGFAFALTIGILVGTYSSIFVATPLVYDLANDLKPSKRIEEKKAFSRYSKKAKTEA